MVFSSPSGLSAAAVHVAAGAASGAIGAALTGGDVGLGALTGGIAGGIGNLAGGYLPDNFAAQLAGRALIGAIVGGISAEIHGGKFGQGFALGAQTGAIGFLANDFLHRGLAAEQTGGTVSDAPRFAASDTGQRGIDLGELYEKTIGHLDKAFAVVSVATAGVASVTLGTYLLAISPTTGPAFPIVAAKGFTFLGSGAFLLNQARVMTHTLSSSPVQVRVPRQ